MAAIPEVAFPNDGWSGSTLTALDRGDARFILKRTSPEADWIVRATRDIGLREGFIAGTGLRLAEPLDHVIEAISGLHAMPWADYRPTTPDWGWPWCPLRERLLLLTRQSAERYRAEGLAVGDRFLAGWDAFERLAPADARTLIAGLSEDPAPLLTALGRLPATGIHGDLKLANVALLDDGRVALIDWQMMTLAPVAVELGWMLVSNSASLPLEPDAVLARYRETAARTARTSLRLGARWADSDPAGTAAITLPPRGPERTIGDWDAQRDLTWIVGLLLRGWRKGLDAEADVVLGSGVRAADDLTWWSARAVEAAGRRLP